ncbi:protein phosphatase 1H isoform X2 [Archocentrus centrarchus]|uniref:protein phosphatase 1H isoform X2 n=1 Tax=Archocentrus centrarchus TaxID=63155 RepID=UPI0011E9F972|nr:protein phosphatase 1H-like isoform X2 [Archocentrus centrarchus]
MMMSKVKNAMSSLVGGMMPHGHHHHNHHSGGGQTCGPDSLPHRFPYGRPDFLDLTPELLQYSTEHASRPVLTLKRGSRLPWQTGYAEVINAGKSMLNEDHLIRDRLGEICHLLENPSSAPPICLAKNGSPYQAEAKKGGAQEPEDPDAVSDASVRFYMEKVVSLESLVMGVIETAFKQMDDLIEKEKSSYAISGGCCALAAIHLMGKLYVANAGDSRAIIIRNNEVIPMTNEFTPESERQRLQYLGFLRPELLGNEFTHIEFPRRIQHSELGKKMLYRDHTMTGWAYKTIVEDDLKFPLIYGEGKKARVMATIGVTRGLGDHDLKVYNSNIYIKPFLSCVPEVKVYNLDEYKHGRDDVLVMGTDGLWDVTTDKEVADAVTAYLSCCDPSDPMRYTLAAQDLLMRSRGVLKERGWRLPNDKLGSGDDITVFVVPLAGQESET